MVVVTAATTAVGVQRSRATILEGQRAAVQELAGGLAARTDVFLESAGGILEGASALIKLSDLEPELSETALARALGPLMGYGDSFEAVVLLDSKLQARWALPKGGPDANRSFAGEAPAAAALRDGSSALSLDPRLGAPYWAVRIPATAGTSSPYLLVGRLASAALRQTLGAQLEGDREALLVFENGAVVAATSGDAQAFWESSEGLSSADRGESSYVMETDSGSDEPGRLIAANDLAVRPGTVVVVDSLFTVEALQREATRSAFLTGGALAAAALLIGIWISQQLARPLSRVEAAARKLAAGDLATRAEPGGSREVRRLATEFNAMAGALQKETDELLALQRQLEDRVAARTIQLELRNRDLDEFAHVVSHDLKAPLRGIRLYAQLVEEKLGPQAPAEVVQNLGLLKDRIQRVSLMIDGILTYSRVGRVNEPWAKIEASKLVADTWSLLAPPKHLRLAMPRALPTLLGPPTQVQQVFQNLLSNAIKYHDKPSGVVTVRSTRRRGKFEFSVEDDGPGIPPERHSAIFEMFNARDRNRPDSTGVGLPTAKRIIEAHGGTLRLESRVGKGSKFIFTWPVEGPVHDVLGMGPTGARVANGPPQGLAPNGGQAPERAPAPKLADSAPAEAAHMPSRNGEGTASRAKAKPPTKKG